MNAAQQSLFALAEKVAEERLELEKDANLKQRFLKAVGLATEEGVETASQKAARLLQEADPTGVLGASKKGARYGSTAQYGGKGTPPAPAVQLERLKMEAKKKALPGGGMEATAGVPFLEQDRPEKVKEIYRALKRDHPEMSAEKKARIASRQGKPGKQRQGPPYDGPLSKEASIFKRLTSLLRRSDRPIERNIKEQVGWVKSQVGGQYVNPDEEKRAAARARVNAGIRRLDAMYARLRGTDHTGTAPDSKGHYVEKNAMPSLKSLGLAGAGGAIGAGGGAALGGLAGLGAGALGGGAAGYVAGKRKDKQTPFHGGHLRYAHGRGRQLGRAEVVHALRRRMMMQRQGKTKKASAEAAGAVNALRGDMHHAALGGLIGARGAKNKTEGMAAGAAGGMVGGGIGSTIGGLGGAMAGGSGGALAGAAIGALAGKAPGAILGAIYGGALGGALAAAGGAAIGGPTGAVIGGALGPRVSGLGKTAAVSDSALLAAAAVLEHRESAHVNLLVPNYIRGY
jgi:hypothetical protein